MRTSASLAIAAGCAVLLFGSCATAPAAKPVATPSASASPNAASPNATPSPSGEASLQPIAWTDDAKAAFEAEVPAMVKKIARKSMEKKARDRGLTVIDMDFYNEIKKEQMGK